MSSWCVRHCSGAEEVAVVLGDQGQAQGPGDGLQLAAAAAGGGRVGDQLAVEAVPVGGGGQGAEEPGRGGEEHEVGPLAGEDLVEAEAVGLQVAAGDDLAQVGVAPGAAGQHDEALAPVGAGAVGPRRHPPGGGSGAEILTRREAPPGAGGQDLPPARLGQLDPEDGPQALAAALLVVEDEPRHAVGVGESHGRHPQLPRSPHDFGNAGDAGVERKRRVAVQVDEAQPHLPDKCTYVYPGDGTGSREKRRQARTPRPARSGGSENARQGGRRLSRPPGRGPGPRWGRCPRGGRPAAPGVRSRRRCGRWPACRSPRREPAGRRRRDRG